ncbi:MAG: polymer-forming cytoskeletal protein [Actinomycetota bacterium]
MTHYRSNNQVQSPTQFFALGFVAVVAVLIGSLTSFAALVTTDRYIVSDTDTVTEDQYVTATSGQVEGVIDGDLVIFSGNLTISGEVTGSVSVFTVGTVRIAEGARVGGSLNGTAGTLHVAGTVEGDVFMAAPSVVLDPSGVVGRDVMAFGGALTVNGDVGRDVRGRTMRAAVNGGVGGDVDMAVQGLDIGRDAVIGGDVLYRSATEADIDAAAAITGTVTRLPAQSNFIYGIILSLASVISFLGFVVTGLVTLWLLRSSSSRAVGVILRKPVRSFLVGLGTVIVFPAAILLVAVTLVGLPVAAIGILLIGIAFIIGPVPTVTALGNRVLWNRGGLFGAFVVGAILWRLGIWAIPVVGGFLYLLAFVWGVGAWVLGLFAARRGDPTPAALLPASLIVKEEIPEDWEPPLAPSRDPEPGVENPDPIAPVFPQSEPSLIDAGSEGPPPPSPLAGSDGVDGEVVISFGDDAGIAPERIERDPSPVNDDAVPADRDLQSEWEAELRSLEQGPKSIDGPTSDGDDDDWGLLDSED